MMRPCRIKQLSRLIFSRRLHAAVKRPSDPLRILFCGSDAFSCASLAALHGEHVRNPSLVEALDVLVLPGRRTGRGLKNIGQVPCKALAENLNLPIHQRDTFRHWNLPHGINLIVVVSFGLFVPPRILQSAKYGGLNVHPSLLPDLRGPAPLHHALLRGDSHMGISLQTLDEKAFDHGVILAQTPAPGLHVPSDATLQLVRHEAAANGAEMLVQGLRDGLHVPPYRDIGWKAAQLAREQRQLQHAPKITKSHGQIDWGSWTADHLVRAIRVLGSVWTCAVLKDKDMTRRLLFLDAEPAAAETARDSSHRGGSMTVIRRQRQDRESSPHGSEERENQVVIEVLADKGNGSCLIQVDRTAWIRVRKVKVDGKPEQLASVGLGSFISITGPERRK